MLLHRLLVTSYSYVSLQTTVSERRDVAACLADRWKCQWEIGSDCRLVTPGPSPTTTRALQ